MGLFPRFEKRSSVSYGSPAVFDDFWYSLAGGASISGKNINKQTAMRLAAVAGCVLAISADISALPLKLLRPKAGGGTEPAIDHPLYHLLKNAPNPEMSSFTWRETGQGQILLTGNKYSVIERSNNGIKALWPIVPEKVTVKRVKGWAELDKFGASRKRGPIVYQVQGEKTPRPSRDVLHVPGFGFNGLQGESIIQNFARESIGNGLSLAEFESLFFKQGFSPGGFFSFPSSLGDNKEKFMAAIDRRFMGTGATGSRRPMVLEDDGKYVPFEIKLADAQFIELMKLSKEDICGIFRVPPAKISIFQKGASYNNTEQQNKAYLDNCITPWLVRDEQAMNAKLLTIDEIRAGYHIKYNFDALLRPDAKSRSEIDQRYWQMGVPLNTMRDRDDLNPVPGGNVGYVPLNFIPVDQAEQPRVVKPVQAASLEHRAKPLKSVRGRDRVSKRFYPLFRDAAQKIVNRESLAVKKEVDKRRSNNRNMQKWIDDFYRDMPEYVQDTIGPTMRSFAESIQEAAAGEIGGDVGLTAELEGEIREYIDGFTAKYVGSSQGQLNSLLDGELAELETRVDEWHEKRADKVAGNETVSMANMVAASVFFAGGFRSVWAIRGPSTCPYCRSLEGRTVAKGEAFVEAGTDIEVEGQDPMPIRGLTKYPSLHQGCDCFISAG